MKRYLITTKLVETCRYEIMAESDEQAHDLMHATEYHTDQLQDVAQWFDHTSSVVEIDDKPTEHAMKNYEFGINEI